MVLSEADRDLFYRLLWRLLFYAGEQLEFLPRLASPDALRHLNEEDWLRLRDSLYERPELFDSFLVSNPFELTGDELTIVRSWKAHRRGKYFVWRYLKNYAVFLDDSEPGRALGVVSLNKPFQFMLGPHLPVAIEAVLLPFKNMIVYDGLFSSYPISFGPGIRRMLNDSYRRAKEREGIVTSFAQLASPPTAEHPDDVFELRYWHGFTRRLPYRLDSLKLVSHEQIKPDKVKDVIKYARKERILYLPVRIGLEEGFEPIQVEVLELVMDGRARRVEVLNRGASMFYIKDPNDIRRFHRFVYKLEEALPDSLRPLL